MKTRILLADDEQSVRHAYSMLLSDEHDVVEAANGVEALRLFSEGSFDLVITDYEMPFMKGNELARRVRELRPNQPLIMITAYHPAGCKELVDAIVHKPFTLAQLQNAIAAALGTKR